MTSRPARTAAPTVLAVDAGGSSTRAAVVDGLGAVLGYATGAAGNPTSSGREPAAANVTATVRAALDDAGGAAPERIAVAMAGASTAPPDWLGSALAAASVPGTVAMEADLAATYLTGSRARLGYAVVSGTGAIAARLVDHRIVEVSDGLGWLVGDDGSGFWIGHRVLRAVAAALDGRGPATTMTVEVLGALPPSDGGAGEVGRPAALGALLSSAYAELPVRLARFAPIAFGAADAGDAVALEIVAEAARGLARTLGAVLADDHDAPIVLGGGVLAGQPRMADTLRAELVRRGLRGRIVIARDGVVGAAVLALEGCGIEVDETVVERIASELEERRRATTAT